MNISHLLRKDDEEIYTSSLPKATTLKPASVQSNITTSTSTLILTRSTKPVKRPRNNLEHRTPVGQGKWTLAEDAKLIELRGNGMKWEDIEKYLPGRSETACRLRYQNHLERRSEWDDRRKNLLANLYARFMSEMWSRIAEEMAIPWRLAETMHWRIGQQELAHRAGVAPFLLVSSSSLPHAPTWDQPRPPLMPEPRDFHPVSVNDLDTQYTSRPRR